MNDKLRPALVGGIMLGVLSGVPFISLGNACCCAWVLAGGALAAHRYIKASPTPVSSGDGAQVGLYAGLVGAGVFLLIGIPLGLLAGDAMNGLMVSVVERTNPEIAEQVRRQVELAQNQPLSARLPQIFLYSLGSAVVLVLFATIGGLLGVALFEKRKPESSPSTEPPPPPAGFGG